MKEKLYPFHVAILIFMTQTGVVIFSLPRVVAEKYGYNGWIVLFLFAGISTFNIFLIALVYRLGKGRSIFEILEQSLSKFLLYPLYLILISVWAVLGCTVAKQYVIIFQMLVFPTTHPMLFKFFIDILIFLLVIKGIYTISKATTIFFWLIIWMMLIHLFFIKDFEFVRLTPFIFQGDTDMIMGGLDIYTAFIGYELALILIPFAKKNTKFMRAIYIGNLFTFATYLPLCIISFGFYSFGQLTRMKYPLLEMLSYMRLPFIERIEIFLFGFLLFSIVVTSVMYIWAAMETLRRIIPKAKTKWLAAIILCASFFVAWIPDILNEVEEWIRVVGYIETGIAFGLPIILITILLIQKGVKNNA
ncbi:MAG: GerAB/ArcD/ProY family transporter [Candidatus Pristimantibacillus sp.]